MSRIRYSPSGKRMASTGSDKCRKEAKTVMTTTKVYHRPDCAHVKDRETACNCTPPFPLELTKTKKPAEAKPGLSYPLSDRS